VDQDPEATHLPPALLPNSSPSPMTPISPHALFSNHVSAEHLWPALTPITGASVLWHIHHHLEEHRASGLECLTLVARGSGTIPGPFFSLRARDVWSGGRALIFLNCRGKRRALLSPWGTPGPSCHHTRVVAGGRISAAVYSEAPPEWVRRGLSDLHESWEEARSPALESSQDRAAASGST
jgi:hypothetical protein